MHVRIDFKYYNLFISTAEDGSAGKPLQFKEIGFMDENV